MVDSILVEPSSGMTRNCSRLCQENWCWPSGIDQEISQGPTRFFLGVGPLKGVNKIFIRFEIESEPLRGVNVIVKKRPEMVEKRPEIVEKLQFICWKFCTLVSLSIFWMSLEVFTLLKLNPTVKRCTRTQGNILSSKQ